jgi:hypothetical protein
MKNPLARVIARVLAELDGDRIVPKHEPEVLRANARKRAGGLFNFVFPEVADDGRKED